MTATEEATEGSPRPRLLVFALIVIALVASLAASTLTGSESRWSPDLALDLEGGTQIILTPVTDDGSEITPEDISQAIEIIRQRVDASGVAEAEITSQGGSNIVVGLPGTPSEETLDLVRTSAVLRLRAVIDYTGQVLANTGLQPVYEPGVDVTEEQLAQAREQADLNGDGSISAEPTETPDSPSSDAWITEEILYQALTLDCTSESARVQNAYSAADSPVVACDPTTGASYILGPAELDGSHIDQATSGPRVNEMGQTIGGWQVNMEFTGEGGDLFGQVTTRLAGYPYGTAKNLFAIVLDGSIISVASLQAPILGGSASISGSFTAPEAASLANQLSFGSLPLTFEVQSEEQISATLGSEQLVNSLIAGAIGAGLIVLYLLWQYQGLGLLAVTSITMVMGLSYLTISLLSWTMGYRLSLAGVVGLIISIGISADSFIVYFERVRDEIREGRTLRDAVDYGWNRARQTILVSDAVNLVAAIVLYFLAVGGVRGFAFTLGLTTVIDVVVVILFTYPVMKLLVRTKFFGEGHRLSGMSAASLGADPVYAGRGRVRDRGVSKSEAKANAKKARRAAASEDAAQAAARAGTAVDTLDEKSQRKKGRAQTPESHSPGERPMTLAQRKAAERRAGRDEN
ncbi:protein translocase subunit SecD [Flaviflexus salsibiostraticola]|uniref:Protein translocase subunit SecD n=1 Tax=Flaviflexus salsibiostraticola TaxID=1282737 RepID=A0A3S8Z6U7_9ACTO|nr:protein translocase subunit SecD [Flaviflexus salsibiostraticola]AZN29200.1 protein translocase subunit SecD [Flaviflexus salsibiostraticola]